MFELDAKGKSREVEGYKKQAELNPASLRPSSPKINHLIKDTL